MSRNQDGYRAALWREIAGVQDLPLTIWKQARR
jgi:hypothetical protein